MGSGSSWSQALRGEAAVEEAVGGRERELDPLALRAGQPAQGRRHRGQVDGRALGGLRGPGDDSLAEPPLPLGREGGRVEGAPGRPVGLHVLEGAAVAGVEECRQQVDGGRALVERRDERLDQRRDAVAGPGVAPALERVALGQPPAAAARGLVLAQGEVEGVGDLGEQRAQVEPCRRGVHRVPGGDDQGVELAALDLAGQRGERRGRRRRLSQDGAGVADRHPHVAQRRVHGVGEGVDGRRLAKAGQHQRAATVGGEVRGHGPGRAGELGGQDRGSRHHAELGGHGAREGRHLGAPHAEAVIGVRPGERHGRLGDVEPAHPRAGLPVARELAGEPQRIALPGEEVGVEGEDGAGRLEAGPDVERAAEGDAGPLGGVLLGDRRPHVEAGLREARLEPAAELGLGGRGVGGEQEGQARAAVGVVRPGELLDLGEEAPPGERDPGAPVAAGPLRVVEVEEGSLVPGGRGPLAGGVGRVSFHLHRPSVRAGDQEPGGVAVEGQRGRVVELLARAVLDRLVHEGDDLLARRLAGRQASQRRGRPQDLHEGAPRHLRGDLGRTGRELPAARRGPGLELPDALPERAMPRGAGLGLVLDDRQRFHRWHVEQLTREWTS